MRKFKSTTYTKANFEQIATAIGTTLKPVADLKAQFEAAALWFRLDKRRPKRPAPSKQHEKLTQVAKSARRLLKSLGIAAASEPVKPRVAPDRIALASSETRAHDWFDFSRS